MRIYGAIAVGILAAFIVEHAGAAQRSAGQTNQTTVSRSTSQTAPSAAPVIILRVSGQSGEFEDFGEEIKVSDRSAAPIFRWSYTGLRIRTQLALIAYDIESNEISRRLFDAPAPNRLGQTSVSLSDLPEGTYYAFHVQPVDSSGSLLPGRSNPVAVIVEAARPVPFLFGALSLDSIRAKHPVPGAAVGILCPGGQKYVFASGTRRHPDSVLVQDHDNWHIGSNSKQFTTTLLAKIIEDDPTLDWSTTLGELINGPRNLIPELRRDPEAEGVFSNFGKLHPTLDDVTIEQLAAFRSGINLRKEANSPTRVLENYARDPSEFRLETVQKILMFERARPVGTYRYGQGEYMVLSVIIERLKGKPFEQVMQTMVFDPLELGSARYGMPTDIALSGSGNHWVKRAQEAVDVDTTAAPNGHSYPDEQLTVDNLGMPPVWNAPGGITINLDDWLDFLGFHITGRSRNGALTLSQASLAKLHAAYNQADKMGASGVNYGPGWSVDSSTLGLRLDHNGSYGRFFSRNLVYPGGGIAVAAASNAQGGQNSKNPKKPKDPYPFWGDDVVNDAVGWAVSRAQTDCPPVLTASEAAKSALAGAPQISPPDTAAPGARTGVSTKQRARITRTPGRRAGDAPDEPADAATEDTALLYDQPAIDGPQ